MTSKPAGRTPRKSGRTAGTSPGRRARASSLRPAAARPLPKARPLGKREMEEFRRLLEAEQRRLTQEREAILEHLPEIEQVGVDSSGSYDEDLADVASDAFEREKVIAIENSVQALLRQVEEALDRLKRGTYGTCAECGQPIHPDRLRALPYARLCINCKAREEQAIRP